MMMVALLRERRKHLLALAVVMVTVIESLLQLSTREIQAVGVRHVAKLPARASPRRILD